MTTLEQLRQVAREAVRLFNDHVQGCHQCDTPPAIYLCPIGTQLNDDAAACCAVKLQAETAELRRSA